MVEEINEALKQQFFNGMSHAACTVNIVTTDGAAGRAGVTVSAMSSVSADTPQPTLLVCVHQMSPAAAVILENGVFCVNVLRDDQSYISDTFAGRFKDQVEDKFECADWTTQETGAPRVVDPLVAFDCKLSHSELIGTHYVFFGAVEDIFVADKGSPLIYANRTYGAAVHIDSATSIAAGQEMSAQKLSVACLLTFGPYILPGLVSALRDQHPTIELNLIEGDQRRIQNCLLAGEAEIGLLYDMGLPDDLVAEPLMELDTYVLLAEGHPLAEKSELVPEDLKNHPMVLLDAPPSREYFLSIMHASGIEPEIAYRSQSFEMVRGFVGHGLGYALLATRPASSETYDGLPLVTRPLIAPVVYSPVILAYRRNSSLSAPANKFAELCRETLGQTE